MAIAHKDNKEIRLFGDKSIREEAYRKKILQLEKDISNLEVLAKSQEETRNNTPAAKPENLNNLYYESLMSFDMRIKKEQDFLEKRATEITERLDIQAQKALLGIEKLYRRQAIFLFFMIFCFTVFIAIILFYPKINPVHSRLGISYTDSLEARIPYIRDALSGTAKYRHNYTIGSIFVADNKYIVNINLDNVPGDIWYLRDMAQEAVSIFNRFSGRAPGEINFSYNGKVYAKATLSGPSSKPYIRYFQ
jgi:hypothetical protein